MGRVVVEAFSAGVPVVAFPVGGIPEIVNDGQTGFLTGGVSPEALAARICDVMASEPEALHGIAANARRAWERSYTVAAYQKQITDQVERLVSAGPAECGTEALLPHR
jgi:glycosyltransferase involved in cell wall biosynthesis